MSSELVYHLIKSFEKIMVPTLLSQFHYYIKINTHANTM